MSAAPPPPLAPVGMGGGGGGPSSFGKGGGGGGGGGGPEALGPGGAMSPASTWRSASWASTPSLLFHIMPEG